MTERIFNSDVNHLVASLLERVQRLEIEREVHGIGVASLGDHQGSVTLLDFLTGVGVTIEGNVAHLDLSTVGSVTDHGTLTGLADDDHPQYVDYTLADAKGDLLVAPAADDFTRLPVGPDGEVLTANSAAATGVSWQVPGASQVTFVSVAKWGARE